MVAQGIGTKGPKPTIFWEFSSGKNHWPSSP